MHTLFKYTSNTYVFQDNAYDYLLETYPVETPLIIDFDRIR